MKGVFGILLVGGGVILMVGLFTGKITFPLGSPGSSVTSSDPNAPNYSPAAAAAKNKNLSKQQNQAPVAGKHGQVGTAGIPKI